MREYLYKVSVIVPVYNVEKYIRNCIESLVNQTIDINLIEVILIDDGSSDCSYKICKEYQEIYPFIKLYKKENGGVSSARNYGIMHAQGKYIMFLDSDDMLEKTTVKAVTDFFDSVYDQVDLVTYRDESYKNGKKQESHFRYNYLKKSGIYDLNDFPYILQARVSVCVKNVFENNVLFPVDTNLHEDLQYCNMVVEPKMKIGFCDKGEYLYNKSNHTSIMKTFFFPKYLFEGNLCYYENLFSRFDIVPKYYQAMYIHDLSWKLKENVLMPHFMQGEAYDDALRRMKSLIDKVDDDIIMNCPSTDSFHRHYFLSWKKDLDLVTLLCENNKVSLMKRTSCILEIKSFETILVKIRVVESELRMIAFIKSTLFNYVDKPDVYFVYENNKGEVVKEKQSIYYSPECYYRCKEHTNNFWQFEVKKRIEDIVKFYIEVDIDGFQYPTHYWTAPTSPFCKQLNITNAYYGEWKIKFINNIFEVFHNQKGWKDEILASNSENKSIEIKFIREHAVNIKNKKIWLYYDCDGVDVDNGWYQFEHDFNKDDGIQRYFIKANMKKIIEEQYVSSVVEFGSITHKILFCAADKIITAFIETENICPFNKEERRYISDIAQAEIIYLQHGILHAHLPWKYAPGRIEADRIVISSKFEENNFVNVYNFRTEDLIRVGMPRFDFLDKNKECTKRILFAPSWRNYLIGSRNGTAWDLTEDRFIQSDYFTSINNFLNSAELEEILCEKDIFLDFKIHPIFVPYLHLFNNDNAHVHFGAELPDDEYAMMVTDFSSYVFNFGYMCRDIVYYVPDYDNFIAGLNQYRELDLPFEKAFGRFTTDWHTLLDYIHESIKNNFIPSKLYRDRMNCFYYDFNNCREKIYRHLIDIQ